MNATNLRTLALQDGEYVSNLWIISNKNLYAPLQKDFKYKYRELKTKPSPQKRWEISWIDYKVKIKHLRRVLK